MDPHVVPHHRRYGVPRSASHGVQRLRAGVRPRNAAHCGPRSHGHLHGGAHLGSVHGSPRRRNRRLWTSRCHNLRTQVGSGRAVGAVRSPVLLHCSHSTHRRGSHLFLGSRESVPGNYGTCGSAWRLAAILPRLSQRGVPSLSTVLLLHHRSYCYEHRWSITAEHWPSRRCGLSREWNDTSTCIWCNSEYHICIRRPPCIL
mmetsp:Transcript_2752/g.17157  ORF Transcript_2752/g.17157 Transcript_2752/m.17157 type:complete len:201 (-) Transcript_2752:815-1417(-)